MWKFSSEMENHKRIKGERRKDSSSNDDSEESSEDDANRFVTSLPVIIEIKVKPGRREQSSKKQKRVYSQPVVPLPELSVADFVQSEEEERDLWQIFERKPSDQYNKALRDSLSHKLVNVGPRGEPTSSARSEIEKLRSLLMNSDGSDCDCQCGDELIATPSIQNPFFLPELSLPIHSKCSTPQQSAEHDPLDGKLFSKAIEVTNSLDRGRRELPAALDDSCLSTMHEPNEKSATFQSAKSKSSTWFKSFEAPNKWIKSSREADSRHEAQADPQRKQIKARDVRVPGVHNELRTEKHPFPLKNRLSVAAKDKQCERNQTTAPSVPPLSYKKIADALRSANTLEKCRLVEALQKVVANS